MDVAGPPRGQLKAIDHDCNDIPDAAMTLAVAALYANGSTAIRNVYNWRVKETERMVAIVTELGKLGAQVGTWHRVDTCMEWDCEQESRIKSTTSSFSVHMNSSREPAGTISTSLPELPSPSMIVRQHSNTNHSDGFFKWTK